MSLSHTKILQKAEKLIVPFSRQTLLIEGKSTSQHSTVYPDTIFGSANLPEGEEWPKCLYCQQKMILLFQVSTELLSKVLPGFPADHILQIFCCLDEGDTKADYPDSEPCCNHSWNSPNGNHLIRLINKNQNLTSFPPQLKWTRQTRKEVNTNCPPPLFITVREAILDMPDITEAVALIDNKIDWITLYDAVAQWMKEHKTDLPPFYLQNNSPLKIGGWPQWMQSPNTPKCSKCQSNMRYIIQFNLLEDFNIASDIWVHAFYCEDHWNETAIRFETT